MGKYKEIAIKAKEENLIMKKEIESLEILEREKERLYYIKEAKNDYASVVEKIVKEAQKGNDKFCVILRPCNENARSYGEELCKMLLANNDVETVKCLRYSDVRWGEYGEEDYSYWYLDVKL